MTLPHLPSWAWSSAAAAVALSAGILIGRAGAGPDREATADADVRESRPVLSDRGRGGLETTADRGNRSAGRGDDRADTETKLNSILESTSRLDRTQRLLAFLDRLDTGDFGAIYQALADSPLSEVRQSERSLILQAWAERDPMGAVAHLQENGANDWERETTLSTWAALDPRAAMAWASNAEDEGRVNNWVLGALRGVAEANPELARDFLIAMEPGDTREQSMRSIRDQVMSFGYDYAESWIAGITDTDLQNSASRRFAGNLAEADPERAATWTSAIADTGTRRDVSETVSDRMARNDLESAKAWVMTLPLNTRTEAAEGVARHYARQDPVAAVNWLSGLGDDPDYDGARQILVREAFRRDPETSMNFVASISNERNRTRSYYRYLRDWARRDSESARAWTATNQAALPENLVQRIFR